MPPRLRLLFRFFPSRFGPILSLPVVVSLLPACSEGDVQVRMDLKAEADFFASPFPSDARTKQSGELDLSAFPNPTNHKLVAQTIDLAARTNGFGRTSAVYFPLTGAIADDYPQKLGATTMDNAPLGIVPLEEGVLPSHLTRHPIDAHYQADGGPYGAPHLLSLLPQQGYPLADATSYVAYVTNRLLDARGRPLGQGPTLSSIVRGERPAKMSQKAYDSHRSALKRLKSIGIPSDTLVGLTVFTTGAPTTTLSDVFTNAQAEAPVQAEVTPQINETFDDYCVFEGTVSVPVYQEGTPPYATGGGFVFEGNTPIMQRRDEARIVITVPRSPQPKAGFPVVLFSRTGAGGDRPLVDRGPRTEDDGPTTIDGDGPARIFSQAGFAAVSIDGPHGGLRNITGGDEQFLIFNIQNPTALRENVRQSALELALEADFLQAFVFDAEACPDGPADLHFDTSALTLMGHSMGATIAPLALALNEDFHAAILSGAGGSWIENIIYKLSPFPARTYLEVLLDLPDEYALHRHDPFLNVLQWAAESADPPAYADKLRSHASHPHLLMLQGIVDTYILPPIANTTSLSFGLDLGGESLDTQLPAFTPLADLLALTQGQQLDLPAMANAQDGATQIVVQHEEDGIEDGHEVSFQVEGARNQIRCFLETLRTTGSPIVVEKSGRLSDPCPAP